MLEFIAALFALSFSALCLIFVFLAGILLVKDSIELMIMWIKDLIRK